MKEALTNDLVAKLRHWNREDDLDIGHEAADEIERLGRDRDAYKREADETYREVANLRSEVSGLKRDLLRVQKSSDRCTCGAAATDPYCRFHGGM